jgi:DNA-binding HxlR family transcriptional regulator
MLGRTYDGQYCSIARTLDLVGERWSLLIMREAVMSGITRYSDFQHNLGIATNVLKSRLDGFIDAGLMIRDATGDYQLTEMGRDLYPVLLSFVEWGDKWRAPDGPPGLFVHADCGELVHTEIRCPAHGVVATEDVTIERGPGAPDEWVESRRTARVG